MLTVPTLLTWLRIVLIPIFVSVYYLPDYFIDMHVKNITATIIFGIAGFTDYLDGYLARKLNQISAFGAFLDPVADKIVVVASLIMLVGLNRTFILTTIIIITRELVVSAMREWMAQIGKTKHVAVAFIGKLKTTVQLCAITCLLLDYHTNLLGNCLIIVAVALTLISMVYYLKQFDFKGQYE